MRKINLTTYLFMICFVLGNIQFSNAQLLKKLKETATGKSETTTTSKGGSNMIGSSEINDEFAADEYGLNGIYYAQTNRGISKNKFEFEICKDKSTAKGARICQDVYHLNTKFLKPIPPFGETQFIMMVMHILKVY